MLRRECVDLYRKFSTLWATRSCLWMLLVGIVVGWFEDGNRFNVALRLLFTVRDRLIVVAGLGCDWCAV